jgi:hypothetical protein
METSVLGARRTRRHCLNLGTCPPLLQYIAVVDARTLWRVVERLAASKCNGRAAEDVNDVELGIFMGGPLGSRQPRTFIASSIRYR